MCSMPFSLLWLLYCNVLNRQKLGSVVFCMAKESGLLYWGGDYQRELQIVQQNRTVFIGGERVAKRRHQQITESSTGNGITLDFRMIAGVALRSRYTLHVVVNVVVVLINLLLLDVNGLAF